jgi:hypothetical protein
MGGVFGGGGGGGGAASQDYGPAKPAAGYTNPRNSVGSPYVSSYTPQTATPFLQSVMAQHSGSPLQQGNSLGLPSLQSMFNMPQNGSPLQTSGIQQLATMAPYISSAYRPDMSGAMNRLNFAAPSVRPEQVSELDVYGKPIVKENPVSEVISDAGGGG